MPESAVPELSGLETTLSQQGIYSQDMILVRVGGTYKFNIERISGMTLDILLCFFGFVTVNDADGVSIVRLTWEPDYDIIPESDVKNTYNQIIGLDFIISHFSHL
jgi:hypothetical protein